MAKCAMCIFHEKDKCMENAWFLPNYNEVKTMRFPCDYSNAWKKNMAHSAMLKNSEVGHASKSKNY